MAQSKKKVKNMIAGFRIEEPRMNKLKKLARAKSVEQDEDVSVSFLINSAIETAYGI